MTKQKPGPKAGGAVAQEKAPNIPAAAARLGMPEAILYAARVAGCKAFRNSCVYMDELQEFLVDHPEVCEIGAAEANDKDTEAKWRIEKNKKACRKLDLEYEKEIGELIPRQQLREVIAAAFAPMCVTLEKHLDKTTYNTVCKQLREALEKIEFETKPKASGIAKSDTKE